MVEFGTYSHNDGKAMLESKGLLDDVHEIPSIRAEFPFEPPDGRFAN